MAIISFKTKKFEQAFEKLPKQIKKDAMETFANWKSGENLKIQPMETLGPGFYSVSFKESYRALGIKQKVICKGETLVYFQWYYIGTHEEYNKEYKNRKGADSKMVAFKDDIREKLEMLMKDDKKIKSSIKGGIQYT